MAKTNQNEKHFLNLAGEYGVCSELAKRKIQASITLGNHKATDIIIVSNKKSFFVEVKTTNKSQFPTNFFQKFPTPETEPKPDFWVLVHIDSNLQSEFYVLTHEQMANEQNKRNKTTEWKPQGIVDNVLLSDLEQYKNKWNTILEQM